MKVQKSLLPFSNTFTTVSVEDCKTIQDIVDKTIPYNFKDCKLIVTLNNEIVSPSEWSTLQVKENDVVGLNFVPQGGKGGKMVLQIMVMVAAVAATIYTGGAAAAAFANGSYVAGGLWAAGTVAISMAASMAIGALTAVPKQTNDRGYLSSSDKSEANVYGLSTTNGFDKWGVVPINLGVNRMYPKQAALPYTEIMDNDQYMRQLFTWGYGKVSVEDMKLGDTDLSSYTDIQIAHSLNGNLKNNRTLYSNDVYQEDISVALKYSDGPVVRTSHTDADEIIIDIGFQGLTKYNSSGNRSNTSVQFRIETKPVNDTTWTIREEPTVTASTNKALRKSYRYIMETQGQYDIRITRLTADSTSDRLVNDSYWTAIRTVTYTAPINFDNISGTAMRIKATDQLNGSVDSFNAVVSSYVNSYDPTTDTWINAISSNPADLFRYVLQCPAFAKAVSDDKIDLEKLKEWWVFCDNNNLTYNRIIDYETSIDDVLNDICAAGMATLSKADNVYSVIIDNERPIIKGLITPRNSWDYEGNITYPDLPHGLRIEFRNKDKGYETDERLVFRDGYNESNATLYERLQFASCTNADLAYWYGKRYFATATLQPETHSFKMDFENLTFNRGDRITLVNDVILVGVGQGRIKELITSGDSVTGFKIDDEVAIPTANNFGVRIRNGNGSGYTYHLLETTVGQTDTFTFATPVDVEDAPTLGSLCAFVEDGKELDLIITQIQPGKDHTATITAINYAPERFNPLGPIPPFESYVTPTWENIVPVAPISAGAPITNEQALIKNSDGSYTSTMIIPLSNKNVMPVEPIVKVQVMGSTEWIAPTYISRDPENVVITDLQDGLTYNVRVYYSRLDAQQQVSLPLQLNGIMFIGGSELPDDVENFKVSVMNGIGLFDWKAVDNFDLSHYIIKFNNDKTDVEWNTSQLVYEKLQGNSVSMPIHEGTYLIKAVDYYGNESRNPAVIISNDRGAFNNVIERLTQEPTWSGVKEDIILVNGHLRLADGKTEGYYYLTPAVFDLSETYTCLLLSEMRVGIVGRSGQSRLVRDITNVRSVKYIRSTDEDINYTIRLDMATSLDGTTWTNWETFTASQHTFRYVKFRLYMQTDSLTMTPEVSNLSMIIDMPDRYESAEDVEIIDANAGKEIEFEQSFKNIPSVNITVQDGAVDDRIEFVDKSNSGFTIKVFNATLNAYVARSFDYIAAGYGRNVQ